MVKINVYVENLDEGPEVYLAGANIQVPDFSLQAVREFLESEHCIDDVDGHYVEQIMGCHVFVTPSTRIVVERSDTSTAKIPIRKLGKK